MKRNGQPKSRKALVRRSFSQFVCLLVGHKLLEEEFKCCRCGEVLWCPPEPLKKVIEIVVKDEYDEKVGSVLEYGIVSPLDYYKTKKFVIENGLSL